MIPFLKRLATQEILSLFTQLFGLVHRCEIGVHPSFVKSIFCFSAVLARVLYKARELPTALQMQN